MLLSSNFIIHEAFLKSCLNENVTFSTLQESSTDTVLEAFFLKTTILAVCEERELTDYYSVSENLHIPDDFCWWHSFFKGKARFKQKCFYFHRLCSLFFLEICYGARLIQRTLKWWWYFCAFSSLHLFLWQKVNSSMSNKTVLYPDHFVGPCINHWGGTRKRKRILYIYTHTQKKSLFGIETKQPNYQELCILMLHDLTKTTQSQISLKLSLTHSSLNKHTEREIRDQKFDIHN